MALTTNSVITPPSGSSSGASSTVAVRQQSPVTKSVNSVCDLQSPTAVHSDYQDTMDLDLYNTVAALANSATNRVDFAEKVTTFMVDCSNVLDNSDNDLKVINIFNS